MRRPAGFASIVALLALLLTLAALTAGRGGEPFALDPVAGAAAP